MFHSEIDEIHRKLGNSQDRWIETDEIRLTSYLYTPSIFAGKPVLFPGGLLKTWMLLKPTPENAYLTADFGPTRNPMNLNTAGNLIHRKTFYSY